MHLIRRAYALLSSDAKRYVAKEEIGNNGHNVWRFKEKVRKQCTL